MPAIFSVLLVSGCSKPDDVRVIRTPMQDVVLTFETWNNGPLVSDRTKLVAHYTKGGKSDTDTILDGDYLVISKYDWSAPERLTLCLKSGATSVFKNEIDLRINDAHRGFHVILREDCDAGQ